MAAYIPIAKARGITPLSDNALFQYIKSNGYDSAYFGLSDSSSEGTWKWVDGTSFTYTNWADGEPNGYTYENYGMFYCAFPDGKWNDGDFSRGSRKEDTNTFICEWDCTISSNIVITDSQTYSKTLDLLEDNNFITEELQIDGISEVKADNYAVGQVEYSTDSVEIGDVDILISATNFEKK